jgi:hypothetical protein
MRWSGSRLEGTCLFYNLSEREPEGSTFNFMDISEVLTSVEVWCRVNGTSIALNHICGKYFATATISATRVVYQSTRRDDPVNHFCLHV